MDARDHGARARQGVVFVGRVSVSKGSEVLKHLSTQLPAVLNVVGDGPDLAGLRGYCDSHGLTNLRFWGRQPQHRCYEIMASSQCTVIPSQCGEAFPLVAVESLAVGTPVVGSDFGGLGDFLRQSGGGIAVRGGRAEGFGEALSRLHGEPEGARELGEQGRRYVEQHLGNDKDLAALERIYGDVVQSRGFA